MKIQKIETNYKRNLFCHKTEVKPKKYSEGTEFKVLNVYPELSYQKVIGFGGAITQAAGVMYQKLSEEQKRNFIRDYFENCNYNFCRIPIGSCDFSPESYSYAYKKELSDFSIEKDTKYIFPLLNDILKVKPDLVLLASPWSPPAFMKNNKMLVLGGKLKKKYYGLYAQYVAKYIKAYHNVGINIQYITVQNEPNAIQTWESCLFTAEEEVDFLTNHLVPCFKENNIQTKILVYDHNKEKLYSRAKEIFSKCDDAAGIAFHLYTGDHFENIEICREMFPNKLLIHTEGCVEYSQFDSNNEIRHAEFYAHDMLGDLDYGCNGYIDWNLLLDHKGGPNHKKNYCGSPMMLNEAGTDYQKNLSYYYIEQITGVIRPGAVRVGYSRYTDKIEMTAFKNTDGSIAVVLLNRTDTNHEYNLCMGDICLHDNLDSHAVVSYEIMW